MRALKFKRCRAPRAAAAAAVTIAASLAFAGPALADPPVPFNSCSTDDLPASAPNALKNTIIVDGQMHKGEEPNYTKATTNGGYASALTSVAFRTVADPDPAYQDGSSTSWSYYSGTSSLAGNWQVNYWNKTAKVPFFYTATSSDLAEFNNLPLTVPQCVGDTALRMENNRGLYLHEVIAWLTSKSGWSWSQGDAKMSTYWPVIDYWVQLARALNKKIVWSEPALGWQTLAADPTARAYFRRWGATVVPTFATNFDSPTSGRLMGTAGQWAARVAGDFGMPLGESVQSWRFAEQPDLSVQTSSGLPTAGASGTAPGGGAGTGYLLDPMNENDYVVGGIHYANPLNHTPLNREPPMPPSVANTSALAKYGASLGATYYEVQGVEGPYDVANKGPYPPIHDMAWPLNGTPSSYLAGIRDFATTLAANTAATPLPVTTPLYQLWYGNAPSHYYTTRASAGVALDPYGKLAPKCKDDGTDPDGLRDPPAGQSRFYCFQEIAGYVATSQASGTVALMAYKNSGDGYFYRRSNDTAHPIPSGYSLATTVSAAGNGVVGYVANADVPGTEPFYWMVEDGSQVNNGGKDYFYTSDAAFQRPHSLASFMVYKDLGVNSYLYTHGPTPATVSSSGVAGSNGAILKGTSTAAFTATVKNAFFGVSRIALLEGSAELASQNYGCTTTCQTAVTQGMTLNPTGMSEGRHSVILRMTDGAGNNTYSTPWKVYIDRSAPSFGANPTVVVHAGDPGESIVEWSPADDPTLPDGSPGANGMSYVPSIKVGTGAYVDYAATTDRAVSITATTAAISLKVIAKDEVGNQAAPVTLTATRPSDPEDSTPIDDSTNLLTPGVYDAPQDTDLSDTGDDADPVPTASAAAVYPPEGPSNRLYKCNGTWAAILARPMGFVVGNCPGGTTVSSYYAKICGQNDNCNVASTEGKGWAWVMPGSMFFQSCGAINIKNDLADAIGPPQSADKCPQDKTYTSLAVPSGFIKSYNGKQHMPSANLRRCTKYAGLYTWSPTNCAGPVPFPGSQLKNDCTAYANVNPYASNVHIPASEKSWTVHAGDTTLSIRYIAKHSAFTPPSSGFPNGQRRFWVNVKNSAAKGRKWAFISTKCLFGPHAVSGTVE